jgi:Recombinase
MISAPGMRYRQWLNRRGVWLGSSRKNRLAGETRAAANTAILRIASERAANIAPVIAELHAGGAKSLRDIAAGLNQRGIATARGGTWTATQVARVMARSSITK